MTKQKNTTFLRSMLFIEIMHVYSELFKYVFSGDKLTAFNSSTKFRSLNLKFPDDDKKPKG